MDPGSAGHREALQALKDTWGRVKTEPKLETSLLPPQPPCLGFLSEWDPHACAAAVQVFTGSEPLCANPAPHHWGGTQSRVTAYQGVISDLGRGS